MLGKVGNLYPESKYEIKILKGRVEVRGGMFMVNSSGVINVLNGTVITSRVNADGSQSRIELHSHESFDPATATVTRLTDDQVRISYFYDPYESSICGILLLAPPVDASTNLGIPHGAGMGRALRKFP